MAFEGGLDPYPYESMSPSPTKPNKNGKKSWDELRKSVRDSKKMLANLKSCVPSSFVFRKLNAECKSKTRIYFLGVPKQCRENTLLYIDVPSYEEASKTDFVPQILDWQHLLDSFKPYSNFGQLSREEQLMRERKRLFQYGITSFDVVENLGKFVFPANSSLYVCDDKDTVPGGNTIPATIETLCPGVRLDPKICPTDSNLVAFIHESDIWVSSLTSRCEKRLTFSHKGTGQLSTDPLSSGVPSFVILEEFDRHSGYWWKPTSVQSEIGNITTYQILYEEIDESDVEILNLFAPSTKDYGIDQYRYPRAGTANAKSSLKIVEFEVDKDGNILDTIVEKQLIEPLCNLFPWAEYIVRAGWTPSGKYVHAQLLDRNQERSMLILLPLDHFTPVLSDTEMSNNTSNLQPIQILYDESSQVWINTHDSLHFFPETDEKSIKFIWSSEKTGFRHLYLVTCQLLQQSTTDSMDYDNKTEWSQSQILTEVSLTSGDWSVLTLPVSIDESRELVYFTALKDTPLETHLYYVSYVSPAEQPVRITHLGYSHSITMNSECSMYVSVYSSIEQSPRATVNQIIHNPDQTISVRSLAILMEHSVCPEFKPPELFHYESSSGYMNYGMYYKPHDFQAGKKYPTVLFVYGGPQVQLVSNSFKGLKFLRLHTLASQGYAVIVVDCRGSSNRGLTFESALKHTLGTVEIDEHVEGLFYLNSVVDFIDITRIAIHGWSYGGYLSLMGIAQRPEVFKLAIAGAPVVNWSLYDTGYTERYMGLPTVNIEAYKTGCVLHYIESFPDEENRLLLIHGLIDENVHFHHSSCLINALVKHNKPYRLQVYPNERHGIRGFEASEHYKTMVLSFLQNNL